MRYPESCVCSRRVRGSVLGAARSGVWDRMHPLARLRGTARLHELQLILRVLVARVAPARARRSAPPREPPRRGARAAHGRGRGTPAARAWLGGRRPWWLRFAWRSRTRPGCGRRLSGAASARRRRGSGHGRRVRAALRRRGSPMGRRACLDGLLFFVEVFRAQDIVLLFLQQPMALALSPTTAAHNFSF